MQLLSKALNVPVIIIDTTQITVPGYTGTDVEEILYAAYKKYGIAVENAIVYFDEIDKKGSRKHSDVGGRGVQDVLLAFLEGTTYQTRDSSSRPTDIVPINTSKMIKVAGGAFSDIDSIRKKSIGFGTDNEKSTSTTPQSSDFVKEAEMSEELMGRFPSRVRFRTLNIENMEEILRKSNESILGKQVSIFKKFGVKLVPTDGYIHRIAEQAIDSGMGAGARGLSGKVLETTGPAYEEISWNRGDISEIVLTRETADDPNNFQKVYRITEKGRH